MEVRGRDAHAALQPDSPDLPATPFAARLDAWNRALIDRGRAHLKAAHDARQLGRFHLEAAIQAVHCSRVDGAEPDPRLLVDLHRGLVAVSPTLGAIAGRQHLLSQRETWT